MQTCTYMCVWEIEKYSPSGNNEYAGTTTIKTNSTHGCAFMHIYTYIYFSSYGLKTSPVFNFLLSFCRHALHPSPPCPPAISIPLTKQLTHWVNHSSTRLFHKQIQTASALTPTDPQGLYVPSKPFDGRRVANWEHCYKGTPLRNTLSLPSMPI